MYIYTYAEAGFLKILDRDIGAEIEMNAWRAVLRKVGMWLR